MSLRLSGKRVTLGVSGSIAAYKAVLLARLLLGEGAQVQPVLTRSAEQFVGRATFSGLTGRPAFTQMWDADHGGERHVELARDSDLIIIAPTTADLLARLAGGRADDLLTATALASRCPLLLAPAMHPSMWEHPATQANVATLERHGRARLLGPRHGVVASGDEGFGRMLEPEELLEAVIASLSPQDLAGVRLLVTAGPTVEDLDPVRFVGNRSSGKMGFAIARRAVERGAQVTLLAGPVRLATPLGVERIDVRSALEMERALLERADRADAVVMSAAVADYRPAELAPQKLKRQAESQALQLVANPDLLAGLGARRHGARPVLVGFAVETGDDQSMVQLARGKLQRKRCDLVVVNHASESLGRDDNRVALVDAAAHRWLPAMSKAELADVLLTELGSWLARTA